MPESSPASGTPEEPFDVAKFARDTIFSVEYAGESLEQLEDRLVRIEEVIAARWPRWVILRWRLAREIRASVRGYGAGMYARGDFRGRRAQWASEHVTATALERRRQHDEAAGE